jgi:hypothetical protein
VEALGQRVVLYRPVLPVEPESHQSLFAGWEPVRPVPEQELELVALVLEPPVLAPGRRVEVPSFEQ